MYGSMYVCVCAYVSEHDSVKTVYPLEFKFRMHITRDFIDFGECRTHGFYRNTRKKSYELWSMESNS